MNRNAILKMLMQSFKILTTNGIPPLTLTKCKKNNLLGYQVYGNTSQTGTPTPTNPIDILSVGDKTANLWETNDTNYGWITTTGALSTTQGVSRRILVEQNKTYYYTSYRQSGGFYNCIAEYDENMNYIENTRKNITTGSKKQNSVTITNPNTKYLVCAYYTTQGNAPEWNMITQGNNTMDFIPYGYRIPITVSGINVFNKDTAELSGCTLNGTTFTLSSGSSTANIDVLLPAGTYTLSCTNTNQLFLRNGKVTSGTITSKTNSQDSVTFSFTGSVDGYLRLSWFGGGISNVQIEKGSIAHSYESYVAPRTTDIYVNTPLYKLGNKSDYIDLEQQKVIRNVKYVRFTGSESFSPTSLNVDNYFTCIQNRSERDSTYSNTLSTHYRYGTSSNKDNVIFWSGSNNNFLYFRTANSLGVTSIATFKTFLTDKYDNGTPVIVVYPLATNTTENVTLPDILLNKGGNVISVETTKNASNMWVKYKGKE